MFLISIVEFQNQSERHVGKTFDFVTFLIRYEPQAKRLGFFTPRIAHTEPFHRTGTIPPRPT